MIPVGQRNLRRKGRIFFLFFLIFSLVLGWGRWLSPSLKQQILDMLPFLSIQDLVLNGPHSTITKEAFYWNIDSYQNHVNDNYGLCKTREQKVWTRGAEVALRKKPLLAAEGREVFWYKLFFASFLFWFLLD